MSKKKAAKRKSSDLRIRLTKSERMRLEAKASGKVDKWAKSILLRASRAKTESGGSGNRTLPVSPAPPADHKTAAPPGRGQSSEQLDGQREPAKGSVTLATLPERVREVLLARGMPPETNEADQQAWATANLPDTRPVFYFCQEVFVDSDRAVIIAAQAFIDSALESAIRKVLEATGSDAGEEIHELLTKRPDPPLGTFASRLKMARALGLIDQKMKSSLTRMSRIRNDAAHLSVPFTLMEWLPKLNDKKSNDILAPLSEKERVWLLAVARATRDNPEYELEPRRFFRWASSALFFRLIRIAAEPARAAEILADPIGTFDLMYDDLVGQMQPQASGSSDDSTSAAQT